MTDQPPLAWLLQISTFTVECVDGSDLIGTGQLQSVEHWDEDMSWNQQA